MLNQTQPLRGLIPSRGRKSRTRWVELVALMVSVSFLVITLTSCGLLLSKPPIVVKQKSNLPPRALLLDCEQPSLAKIMQTAAEYEKNPLTNLDLLVYAVKATESIADCTLDKQALRLWREQQDIK